MGTPEPREPAETAFTGQVIAAVTGIVALAMVALVLVRALRQRTRPQYTLRGLLLFIFVLSGVVHGGVRWWQADQAWREYRTGQARYWRTESNERPAHLVTISRPFYLGRFEVTQAQYQHVMGANPVHVSRTNPVWPVEQVSWEDANEFCRRVSESLTVTVRLPSEAEWEYAARAGTRTSYYTGDRVEDLERAAVYFKNAGITAKPVGSKAPNAFGLYDMLGNVSEWCQDHFGPYAPEAAVDPRGPEKGTDRVRRGGSGW